MDEETKSILDMLEQGKITAAEASALIRAASQRPARRRGPASVEPQIIPPRPKEPEGDAGEAPAEDQVESSASEHRRAGSGAFLPEDYVGRSGMRYVFEHKEPLSGDLRDVVISIPNGGIKANVGEPQVVVRTAVSGSSEKVAYANASRTIELLNTGNSLEVRGMKRFGHQESTDISLTLPAEAMKRLRLTTVNGSIDLADVAAAHCELKTVNGRVYVDSGVIDELQTNSVNGGVEAIGDWRKISATTVNGPISIVLRDTGKDFIEIEGRTVNGGIEISGLPDTEAVGYDMQVHSMPHSGVSSNLRCLAIDQLHGAGRQLRMVSGGQRRIGIRLHTVSGHISLRRREEK